MVTSATRAANKYDRMYVQSGLFLSAGAVGDTLAVSAGIVNISGHSYSIEADDSVSLDTPSTTGYVKRNYVYINTATRAISTYATAEGSSATALTDIDKYGMADSDTDPDGLDKYKMLFLGYVDVDGDGSTATGDITDIAPRIERGV